MPLRGSVPVFVFLLWIKTGVFGAEIPHKSVNVCNSNQFLCSKDCPKVPIGFDSTSSVPMCMKDFDSKICVCWKNNEFKNNIFFCDNSSSGAVSEVLCRLSDDCFPTSSDLVCLIVFGCSCLGLEDNGTHEVVSPQRPSSAITLKPVKAYLSLPSHKGVSTQDGDQAFQSSIFSDDFQLKHLLLLTGFILTPLLCWGTLYVYNKSLCLKRPNRRATSPCSEQGSSADNGHAVLSEEGSVQEDDTAVSPHRDPPHANGTLVYVAGNRFETGVCLSRGALQGMVPGAAQPPSYAEAVSNHNSPPPAYEETADVRSIPPQVWQTVLIVHAGTPD